MATPAKHLPPAFSKETIQSLLSALGLPPAGKIKKFKSNATHHSIYKLNFPPECNPRLEPAETRDEDGSTTLVLRVSGKHLPRIKTINEVAVMRFVKLHTRIPVPEVVCSDSSENNALGHEFTLLEKVPGVNLTDIAWRALLPPMRHALLSQLAEYLEQLHSLPFQFIGGMQFAPVSPNIVPGQVLDKACWQAQDIATYWPRPSSATASLLNIAGPYENYTQLCADQVKDVIYAIERHGSLAWCRSLVPRLQGLRKLLINCDQVNNLKLNESKIVLAHKEMHFGNIMCDPLTGDITGIIDWEFAGTVPASRWDPNNTFLRISPNAAHDWGRDQLMPDFKRICQERRIKVLEDARPNANQEAMQEVVSLMQAIVRTARAGKTQV